jgi:DNA-binding NarL/FixJ family response regulator
MTKIKIGLVDDHQLFLKSLALMLEALQNFEVVVEALNGEDLLRRLTLLKAIELPDIMLIDVNMPVMDGIETAKELTKKYPTIKLVALSMNDKESIIINMFKAGCIAYLVKDTHPIALEKALHEINEKGFYNADIGNTNFRKLLLKVDSDPVLNLTPKELHFLQLACSDLTYKEIAFQMTISERAVDGLRENMFEKLQVQSRVGLCLEAIRKDLVKL